MGKGPKKVVSAAIPSELYDALKKRAKEECRTIPGCIRVALREHLEKK